MYSYTRLQFNYTCGRRVAPRGVASSDVLHAAEMWRWLCRRVIEPALPANVRCATQPRRRRAFHATAQPSLHSAAAGSPATERETQGGRGASSCNLIHPRRLSAACLCVPHADLHVLPALHGAICDDADRRSKRRYIGWRRRAGPARPTWVTARQILSMCEPAAWSPAMARITPPAGLNVAAIT
jgi:hypothetical protein